MWGHPISHVLDVSSSRTLALASFLGTDLARRRAAMRGGVRCCCTQQSETPQTVASRLGSYGPPHSTLRFACPVLIWEPWLHLHLIGPCSHLPPESDSLGSCSICHPKVAALALVASATRKWQPWLLLGADLSWQLFGPRILLCF